MAGIRQAPVVRHRFTAEDFERMGQVGILPEGAGYELIDGEVFEMSPEGDRHADVVDRLAELFRTQVAARGANLRIRTMHPIVGLAPTWEPQPDLVLQWGRDARRRPTVQDALLIVEVAETTLARDRDVKLPAYAKAEISEVWIVDLTTDTIFVHRRPDGGRYAWTMAKARGETIAPEALPELALDIDEILGDPQLQS